MVSTSTTAGQFSNHITDDLKPQLLEMGICEVLIPLTNSPSVEVQGNSAAALGNLSSKGMFTNQWSQMVANHA